MKRLTLRIFGMDCTACAPELRRILVRIPGVQTAEVNYASGKAVIEVADPESFSLPALKGTIERAGFRLPEERADLKIVSADSSVSADIQSRLTALFGVASVSADDEASDLFHLTLYPVGLEARDLQAALAPHSCEITAWDTGEEILEQDDQLSMLRRLLFSVALAIPIFLNPAPWIQLILATILQFGPGRYFYRGAYRTIRSFQPGMDFLIALSTTVIYLYSAFLTFTVHDNVKLYFLCEGVLLSLVFFGKYLEIIARGETAGSIRGLVHLIPQKAVRLERGVPTEVSVEVLHVGDLVKIEAGDRIPADGVLVDGCSVNDVSTDSVPTDVVSTGSVISPACYVDESMLTGESEPVLRHPGEPLTGGSLCRACTPSSSVTMRVTHVGRDTALRRMIAMVQEAQSSRAPVQNLVDRIAGIFIPAVLVIATLVFGVYFFLIIPGDLGSALLTMCGVLVVACPCALGLATPTSVMVGTGRAAELGILFRNAEQLERCARVDLVVFDKTGTLTLGTSRETGTPDTPRTDAVSAVSECRALGLEVVMLSGDKPEIARTIASEIGIDPNHVIFGVSPEGKDSYIRSRKAEGRKILMVGDGVNDAPALASADVSLTLPSATEAAREASGIVLTADRLASVPLAIRLAKDTMKNIRGNLLWALCYNLVCIPLAACGVMNPSIASAAMSCSSIAVLFHALLLKNAEPQEVK